MKASQTWEFCGSPWTTLRPKKTRRRRRPWPTLGSTRVGRVVNPQQLATSIASLFPYFCTIFSFKIILLKYILMLLLFRFIFLLCKGMDPVWVKASSHFFHKWLCLALYIQSFPTTSTMSSVHRLTGLPVFLLAGSGPFHLLVSVAHLLSVYFEMCPAHCHLNLKWLPAASNVFFYRWGRPGV